MNPRIENLKEKKLVGMKLTMSLTTNRTAELWKSFLPRRNEIANKFSGSLVSMQIYNKEHFIDFNPNREFEKWATVEVPDFSKVPPNMETFVLQGGLYAVFDYKGSSADNSIFQYIFGTWLSASEFKLDSRPHFEVLGSRYKNNDPDSEEEIWIPVLAKSEAHQ